MRRIEEIDKNFEIESKIEKPDIVFRSVLSEPFSIHGVFYKDGKFRRMPEEVAKSVSDGVHYNSTSTSGGRIRFCTDSEYVAISVKMGRISKMPHFALSGSAGLDMYVREDKDYRFNNTFIPPYELENGYEAVYTFKSKKVRDIMINLPLYSEVTEMYIGLQNGAMLSKAAPYSKQGKIVFYGSSITQGGCATRPGNAYPSIISNHFDIDYLNLGFSGNCKGEQAMANYIAGLDMKLFVLDYDHNAPNPEHLKATHENVFKTVRAANPDLPIIITSATSFMKEKEKRRQIIYSTYKNAVQSGDKNVYFWDGTKEFAEYEDFGTVEGCHSNDMGFWATAKSLQKLIEKII